jgi:hypothetical protein
VQEACLPASVFQPAVIRAMINACASLKLAVPAAVLCQLLLPTPDFSTAFTLLKTTPAARLDADYFEFLWEVSQVRIMRLLARDGRGRRSSTVRGSCESSRPAQGAECGTALNREGRPPNVINVDWFQTGRWTGLRSLQRFTSSLSAYASRW